jgi:hypothetical protein
MPDVVECRSDHAYPGYPLAFTWQGERLEVNEVIAEQRSPRGYTYLVGTKEHGRFTLKYDIITDAWSVEQH